MNHCIKYYWFYTSWFLRLVVQSIHNISGKLSGSQNIMILRTSENDQSTLSVPVSQLNMNTLLSRKSTETTCGYSILDTTNQTQEPTLCFHDFVIIINICFHQWANIIWTSSILNFQLHKFLCNVLSNCSQEIGWTVHIQC